PLLLSADAIIDFSSPAATVELAALAAQARIADVIGTTGLADEDLDKIDAAARHAVIVRSGNISLGVNLLAALTRRAAAALGEEFDIEIVERHHRAAPQGRHRLRLAARRHGDRRPQRHLRWRGRAHRAHAPGRGPRSVRLWRAESGALGAWPQARPLFDGGRSRPRGSLTPQPRQFEASACV